MTNNYFKFIYLLILMMGFILSCNGDNTDDENIGTTQQGADIKMQDKEQDFEKRLDENSHLQPERKKFIDDMLESGLASRIENPAGQPYIYVTEPFYLLSRDEQASIMNVIWHYYITEDREIDVLTIYDSDNGNEIGTFGRKGLLILE